MPKSKIFVITGPSAAGEDSIIKGLKKDILFEKIVTTTTRAMRPGETDGIEYNFISKKEFENLLGKDEFYEYTEEDGGNLYGVTKGEIQRVLKLGVPIVWKLEYKGAITAKKLFPENVSTIYLDVPIDIIERRIRARDNASEEYIKGRLEYAKGWYENKDKFDFVVKNEDGKLDKAIESVVNIIKNNLS